MLEFNIIFLKGELTSLQELMVFVTL